MNKELVMFYKGFSDIVYRTYYYTFEKYRYICDSISRELYIEKFKDFKSYYANNPTAFTEDYLGVRLNWYQRFLLKDKLPVLTNAIREIRNGFISDLFNIKKN